MTRKIRGKRRRRRVRRGRNEAISPQPFISQIEDDALIIPTAVTVRTAVFRLSYIPRGKSLEKILAKQANKVPLFNTRVKSLFRGE